MMKVRVAAASIPLLAVLFCADALACQPCTILELHGSRVRVVVAPRFVERTDVFLSGAEVRILRVRKLAQGEKPRQSLSCLSAYEIGAPVWSGKTDKNGAFTLKFVPAGRYWVAVKGQVAQAVYVVEVIERRAREGASTLSASDGGLVNNKCGIEPIDYFFK